MGNGTVIGLVIVAVVIIAAVYLATRPSSGGAGIFGESTQPAQPEGAAYISAIGGAVGSVLGGVGGLIHQAGGTSPGSGGIAK